MPKAWLCTNKVYNLQGKTRQGPHTIKYKDKRGPLGAKRYTWKVAKRKVAEPEPGA